MPQAELSSMPARWIIFYLLIVNAMLAAGLCWFSLLWDLKGDFYAYGPYGPGRTGWVPHPFITRTLWFWAFAGAALNSLALLALFERRWTLPYFLSWRESSSPENPWLSYFLYSTEPARWRRRQFLWALMWLCVPAALVSHLAGSVVAAAQAEPFQDSPMWAWHALRDGRTLGVLAGMVALAAPLAGWWARRRLEPMMDQALATPLRPRDYTSAIHGTVLEWTFFAQRVALLWWLICVHARVFNFRAFREFWVEHPGQLIVASFLLIPWAANFVAGFYFRASAVATVGVFHKFPPLAFLVLGFSGWASWYLRFRGLWLMLRSWEPIGFVPEWLGPPNAFRLAPGAAAEVMILAAIFETGLAILRLIFARELWRRLEKRDLKEEFGGAAEWR
jgi:hypothetical protein